MMQLMPILSNYQEGSRNAKVYQTHNDEFGVIVYDADNDYNGFASFRSRCGNFAEDWVTRNVTF